MLVGGGLRGGADFCDSYRRFGGQLGQLRGIKQIEKIAKTKVLSGFPGQDFLNYSLKMSVILNAGV